MLALRFDIDSRFGLVDRTPRLLQILDRYGVRATFFCVMGRDPQLLEGLYYRYLRDEGESKETLDYFIEVMRTIAQEAKDSPELLHDAPHDTPNTRVDEARAARQPYLSWRRED